MKTIIYIFILLLFSLPILNNAHASNWNYTELQFQQGYLDAPAFEGGETSKTNILTLQSASGWEYGDNFFFIDFLNDTNNDSFNNYDYYGEIYLNFSFGKIRNYTFSNGWIKDIGFIAGINIDADANVLKYLPGFRLAWDFSDFSFFNTDFTAYIDDSGGINQGGAPKEDDGYMIDINWGLLFSVNGHRFSFEGHGEYISERKTELNTTSSAWILFQPQLRYDLGNLLFSTKDQLYVGIKAQFWNNKLGDPTTDERSVLAILVWRL